MNFYTGNSAGTWTLQICDRANNTGGTFNRAELTLISATGTTTSCASRMTYDWGANGNNNAFTNTTISNTTITNTATIDYGGAGDQNTMIANGQYNFRTNTATFSGRAGTYGFYMDAINQVANPVDSETIMERATFTLSPAARDLSSRSPIATGPTATRRPDAGLRFRLERQPGAVDGDRRHGERKCRLLGRG